MGTRSAAVRKLAIPDLTTTVLTLTITGIAADFSLANGINSKLARRVFYFLGARIGFLSALAIEALTKLVNVVGNLNPGNIGTYEAGNVLIGKMFGLNTAAGLALGLSRRGRISFGP